MAPWKELLAQVKACFQEQSITGPTFKPTATNIVIRGFEKASLWCNVTGHSMEPKINHGDIIALRQCTLNDIQYGEIYAVVLDTIRTIKILRRSPDPSKLRFIPINTEDYDEQEFDKSRIMNVFEVMKHQQVLLSAKKGRTHTLLKEFT